MAKITIGGQPITLRHNCFAVTATGYYGDMDESFHEEEIFSRCDHKMLSHLAMWDQIINNYGNRDGEMETRKDIEKWLKENGWDERTSIPTDSCSYEMLPNDVDTFDIFYYNDKGQCFPVKFEA